MCMRYKTETPSPHASSTTTFRNPALNPCKLYVDVLFRKKEDERSRSGIYLLTSSPSASLYLYLYLSQLKDGIQREKEKARESHSYEIDSHEAKHPPPRHPLRNPPPPPTRIPPKPQARLQAMANHHLQPPFH